MGRKEPVQLMEMSLWRCHNALNVLNEYLTMFEFSALQDLLIRLFLRRVCWSGSGVLGAQKASQHATGLEPSAPAGQCTSFPNVWIGVQGMPAVRTDKWHLNVFWFLRPRTPSQRFRFRSVPVLG